MPCTHCVRQKEHNCYSSATHIIVDKGTNFWKLSFMENKKVVDTKTFDVKPELMHYLSMHEKSLPAVIWRR